MQDAKSWASGSAVLADPGIDPKNFREEVPAFLKAFEDGFDVLIDNVDSLDSYLAGANFDSEDGQVASDMEQLREHLRNAAEVAGHLHHSASLYIADLPEFPDFSNS